MKMVRNIAMAMVVLASATMANADSFVWFETVNTNGNGAGLPGGAQNQPLNLTCDTSLPIGSCSWVIQGKLAYSAGLLGFNYSLTSNAAGPGNNSSASNGIYGANPPFGAIQAGGTGGPGPNLLSNHEGQAGAAPAVGATITSVTFTLTRSYTQGSLEDTIISASIPASSQNIEWFSFATFDYETVKFGANNPIYSGAYPIAGGVVINVDAVPEPGSLGLLGMGALALLRRRR